MKRLGNRARIRASARAESPPRCRPPSSATPPWMPPCSRSARQGRPSEQTTTPVRGRGCGQFGHHQHAHLGVGLTTIAGLPYLAALHGSRRDGATNQVRTSDGEQVMSAEVGGRLEAVAPRRSLFARTTGGSAFSWRSPSRSTSGWSPHGRPRPRQPRLRPDRQQPLLPEAGPSDSPRQRIDVIREAEHPPGYPIVVWVTSRR